jgi:hypothetical protein
MLRGRNGGLVGLVLPFLAATPTPAFARSISLKDAGIGLWIFIIIGAVIVLLQLVPATILFFSFIGTSSGVLFRREKEEKVANGGKAVLPGIEAAPVKK